MSYMNRGPRPGGKSGGGSPNQGFRPGAKGGYPGTPQSFAPPLVGNIKPYQPQPMAPMAQPMPQLYSGDIGYGATNPEQLELNNSA